MPNGSWDAELHVEVTIKQLLLLSGAVIIACAAVRIAHGRDSYLYRVEVTTVGENQYEDSDSGLTILTRNCGEVAEGTDARLMISARNISGWIAFDDGEPCEVTGLIRDDDQTDPQDTEDSGEDDYVSPDEAIGMLA
jgi:hypothetical protein